MCVLLLLLHISLVCLIHYSEVWLHLESIKCVHMHADAAMSIKFRFFFYFRVNFATADGGRFNLTFLCTYIVQYAHSLTLSISFLSCNILIEMQYEPYVYCYVHELRIELITGRLAALTNIESSHKFELFCLLFPSAMSQFC